MSTHTITPLLSSPLQLGPRTAANRIVQAPMSVCYGNGDGLVTEATIDHYARRAAGGAGIVITENFAVNPGGRQLPRQTLISDSSQLPGLTRLAAAIRAEGALAIVQIVHAGRYAGPWEDYENARRLAPSAVEFELLAGRRVTPQEITPAEIESTIEDFARATRLAKEAGFDGVEIHGAQGMLISSFQSPRMNQRNDRYGSDLDRYPLEVIAAVTEAAGPNMVVGYHLFSDEMLPGGREPAHSVEFVRRLEDNGLHFIIPIPTTFESLRRRRTEAPDLDPTAYNAELAAELAGVTSIPVFANGGVRDGAQAERLLETGHVQAVAMARALFADPDWPRKTLAGGEGVRHCDCSPPMCLITQMTGACCQSWPEEIRAVGHWGMNDRQAATAGASR